MILGYRVSRPHVCRWALTREAAIDLAREMAPRSRIRAVREETATAIDLYALSALRKRRLVRSAG